MFWDQIPKKTLDFWNFPKFQKNLEFSKIPKFQKYLGKLIFFLEFWKTRGFLEFWFHKVEKHFSFAKTLKK